MNWQNTYGQRALQLLGSGICGFNVNQSAVGRFGSLPNGDEEKAVTRREEYLQRRREEKAKQAMGGESAESFVLPCVKHGDINSPADVCFGEGIRSTAGNILPTPEDLDISFNFPPLDVPPLEDKELIEENKIIVNELPACITQIENLVVLILGYVPHAVAQQRHREQEEDHHLKYLNQLTQKFLYNMIKAQLGGQAMFSSFKKFTNRILNLPVLWQQRLFDAFLQIYGEIVQAAKSSNEWSPGVQDMKAMGAKKLEFISKDVVWTSKMDGATTELVRVKADYGLDFTQATKLSRDQQEYIGQFSHGNRFGDHDGFYSWTPRKNGGSLREEVILLLEILPIKSAMQKRVPTSSWKRRRTVQFLVFMPHKNASSWTPLGKLTLYELEEVLKNNDGGRYKVVQHFNISDKVEQMWTRQYEQAAHQDSNDAMLSRCAQCMACRETTLPLRPCISQNQKKRVIVHNLLVGNILQAWQAILDTIRSSHNTVVLKVLRCTLSAPKSGEKGNNNTFVGLDIPRDPNESADLAKELKSRLASLEKDMFADIVIDDIDTRKNGYDDVGRQVQLLKNNMSDQKSFSSHPLASLNRNDIASKAKATKRSHNKLDAQLALALSSSSFKENISSSSSSIRKNVSPYFSFSSPVSSDENRVKPNADYANTQSSFANKRQKISKPPHPSGEKVLSDRQPLAEKKVPHIAGQRLGSSLNEATVLSCPKCTFSNNIALNWCELCETDLRQAKKIANEKSQKILKI